MKDRILVQKPSVLPAYKIEGGEFELTLTSKTGKKKVIKGHNEVSEQFQKLASAPLYFGAYPWQMAGAGGLFGGWLSEPEQNHFRWRMGLENFYYFLFGVEAPGEVASGQDRRFKGKRLTGMATSGTQHGNSDRGIIQERTITQLARYQTQFRTRWLFGQGKGDGQYDILYIPMIQNLDTVTSNNMLADSNLVVNGISSSEQAATSASSGTDLAAPHGCWGISKRNLFSSLSETRAATTVFEMDNYNPNSVVTPAQNSLSRYSVPVQDRYWHVHTKAAEFGFAAINNPKPINVRVKQWQSANPYNIQVYCALDQTTSYLYITEFANQRPVLVGAQRVSQTRYCFKYRNQNAISSQYYYANVFVDIIDGQLTNVSYSICAQIPYAYNDFGGDDITLAQSDFAVSKEYGLTCTGADGIRICPTFDQFLEYPNADENGNDGVSAFDSLHPRGVSVGDWRRLSILTELAAMGGSGINIDEQALRSLDDIPFDDFYRLGVVRTSSIGASVSVITSRYSAPFFSCYNTGGVIKETTDTLSISYTLDIIGIDPLQQIINPLTD